MSFGNELKAAREALSLSIQDLAGRTKIRGDYLRALEAESFTALPERTFARSYLQAYARQLQLDPAPLLRDFDRLLPPPAEQVNRPQRVVRLGGGRGTGRRSSGLVGGLLGGLLLLGVAGYFGYTAWQSRSTVSAATQNSPVALPNTQLVKFSLSSTPSGALVYVDNHYLGATPVSGIPLDARRKAELRVEYGGRQTYKASLDLQQDRNLNVSLLPLTAAQIAAQAAAAKAAAAGKVSTQAAPVPSTPVPATQLTTAQNPAPSAAQNPAATQAAPTLPIPTTGATTGQAGAAAPATGVRLTWAGAAWTRVTSATGQVLYEGIPAAGTSRVFPPGVAVRTGSAGMVTAMVSGGQPQKLGGAGEVVTRRF
jgi:cytoskeleton protein RodZ